MSVKVKKEPLTIFGEAIAAARKSKSITQARLGEQIQGKIAGPHLTDKAWQSYIARLEKGSIEPPPSYLRAISEILGKNFEALVAQLTAEKYGLKEEYVSPLLRTPKSLDEIAEWEATQSELWIVTPEFVDETKSNFREAVATCLKRENGRVIFFLPKSRKASFDRYKTTLRRLTKPKKIEDAIKMVPINDNYVALIAACYVIANPTTNPTGYIIIYDRGAPYLGLQMSKPEIERQVPVLEHLIENSNISERDEIV